jgi:hypothetical protein
MRLVLIILACCLAAQCVVAETIDRVVATVNGRPILQSDVDETVRYEALIEGKPLNKVTNADVRATLDRLIDQELLRQQMGAMAPEVSDEDVQAKIAEIRRQHASTPEQWRQLLASYGLDENTFAARLTNQLTTLGFIDRRLRPSIVIDRAAVEAYYRNTFLPQLHKSGATQDPPLTDVQPQIREILTQQRIEDMLTAWLRNLRQQSKIRLLTNDTQVASTSNPPGK